MAADGTLLVPLSATPSGHGKSLPIPGKGDRFGGEDGRRFEIVEPSLHDIFVETVPLHGKEAVA